MTDFADLVSLESYSDIEESLLGMSHRIKQQLEIEQVIDDLTAEHRVAFTPAALVVLSAPLLEASYAQGLRKAAGAEDAVLDVETPAVRTTLEDLIGSIAANPARADVHPNEQMYVDDEGIERRMRTSLSIIKAWWKNFCDIPPFCGETDAD